MLFKSPKILFLNSHVLCLLYSLEINSLFSTENVYMETENDQVIRGSFLFLIQSDCVGAHNGSKMLTAARISLSLEEIGLDDSCDIRGT